VTDYDLDLPVPADALADWICTYWSGMEFEMLLGIDQEDAHHRLALDTMKDLLDRLDRTEATKSRAPNAEKVPGAAPQGVVDAS
jgi:hypothetical protein